MVKKISKYRTLYGASLVLLPILFQYATFIPSFTVGDLFYLLALSLMLLSSKPLRKKKSIAVLIIYIAVLTVICLLSSTLQRPTTSLRYIVYLFGIMYIPNIEGNVTQIEKIFDLVSKVAVILLVIQYFALTTVGIAIPGVLTFLPLTDESLIDYGDAVNRAGRCMSFFQEPSHFAIYAILYLFYILFCSANLNKRTLFWAMLTSLSILMSSSFTGVLGMIAVWGLKILNLFKSRKLSLTYVIIIMIGLSGLVWMVLSTSLGSYLTDQDVYDRQSMGRFSGFQYILDMSIENMNFLFGNGMNDIAELEYLSGWPRLFYYYGLLGSLLYVICITMCAKLNTPSIYLILIIGILMIGTEMNFGSFFMPYMMMVFLTRNINCILVPNKK